MVLTSKVIVCRNIFCENFFKIFNFLFFLIFVWDELQLTFNFLKTILITGCNFVQINLYNKYFHLCCFLLISVALFISHYCVNCIKKNCYSLLYFLFNDFYLTKFNWCSFSCQFLYFLNSFLFFLSGIYSKIYKQINCPAS